MSHFKVGQGVKCKASGMTGKVIEVDPKEKGKYYKVQRTDGSMKQYTPDELTALKEKAGDVDSDDRIVSATRKPTIQKGSDGKPRVVMRPTHSKKIESVHKEDISLELYNLIAEEAYDEAIKLFEKNESEVKMASSQIEFIEYAAEEIEDWLESNDDTPEWFQNKLTKAFTIIEELHSYVEGDEEQGDDAEDKEMKEAKSVNELSKGLLKRYDKAVDKKHRQADGSTKYKNIHQALKRTIGGIRSLKRQSKESIDELSKDTLISYQKKATNQAADNALSHPTDKKAQNTLRKRFGGLKKADKKLKKLENTYEKIRGNKNKGDDDLKPATNERINYRNPDVDHMGNVKKKKNKRVPAWQRGLRYDYDRDKRKSNVSESIDEAHTRMSKALITALYKGLSKVDFVAHSLTSGAKVDPKKLGRTLKLHWKSLSGWVKELDKELKEELESVVGFDLDTLNESMKASEVGRLSYKFGRKSHHNPHKPGSDDHKAWATGYNKAKSAEKKRDPKYRPEGKVPFDPPYSKIKKPKHGILKKDGTIVDRSGAKHSPMSQVRHMVKQQIKKREAELKKKQKMRSEQHGAGEEGTSALTKKYKKDTPGSS